MFNASFITNAQYQKALHEPIKAFYHGANIEVNAPFVAEMIRQSLFQYFGKSAYTKGYRVYTTIKAPLQLAANQAVLNRLIDYDKRHGYRGPLSHLNTLNAPQEALLPFPVIESLTPALVTHFTPHTIYARPAQEKKSPFLLKALARLGCLCNGMDLLSTRPAKLSHAAMLSTFGRWSNPGALSSACCRGFSGA